MWEPVNFDAAVSLDLLSTIVNTDSGTGNREGLAKVAAVLKPWFEKMFFNWETLEAPDGSLHYCAKRGCVPDQGRSKRILLLAHLDTVFAPGAALHRPFQIDGDIARGPGVSDCKSGVVAITSALAAVNPDIYSTYEICVLFNTDEEIGSPGSQGIIEGLAMSAKADALAVAVLVVEPAEGENITLSRKGIGRFELQVFGKAAHSGANYQDGCNAILEMAHKVIAIQNRTDLTEGITLNVGVIQGGLRPNIVPDYAAAEIDLRFCRSGQEEKVIEDLRQIVSTVTINGTVGRFQGGITRPPMPVVPQNIRLFESYQKVARELGLKLGTFHSGGESDANFTAALGIPTLDGVGPTGGGHHSDTEYLRIPSLIERTRLLAAFLNSKTL